MKTLFVNSIFAFSDLLVLVLVENRYSYYFWLSVIIIILGRIYNYHVLFEVNGYCIIFMRSLVKSIHISFDNIVRVQRQIHKPNVTDHHHRLETFDFNHGFHCGQSGPSFHHCRGGGGLCALDIHTRLLLRRPPIVFHRVCTNSRIPRP